MSFFAAIGFSTTSCPPTETFPSVGGIKPVIMRMVVDLPAPLGPRNPSTSPRSTVKETLLTATFAPNALVRFSTLIMAAGVSQNEIGERQLVDLRIQLHFTLSPRFTDCRVRQYRDRAGRCPSVDHRHQRFREFPNPKRLWYPDRH